MKHHVIPPLLLIFMVFVCSQIFSWRDYWTSIASTVSEQLDVLHRYHQIIYPHTDAVSILGLINPMYGATAVPYYYYYYFKHSVYRHLEIFIMNFSLSLVFHFTNLISRGVCK